ncbi:MAG: hypothetical protein SynsKO_06520 [Synoicihabitans sp.]
MTLDHRPRFIDMKKRSCFPLVLMLLWALPAIGAHHQKPHVVLVCGTLHYSPEISMPLLAEELEKFGFRTTLILGEGDPEKKTTDVLPGIEALADADAAIFFSRFLKLPDEEWQPIEDFLYAGKPILGLRTANHSFRYSADHPRFNWNVDFGQRALGSPYVVHQTSATDVEVIAENRSHPIMTHVTKQEWVSPGTLYLARMEEGCVPLLMGSGTGKERHLKRAYGEVHVNVFETAPIAWAWENEWGGRSFYTSLGHPGDFIEESFVRMVINAVHWGLELPVPSADAKVSTWKLKRLDK